MNPQPNNEASALPTLLLPEPMNPVSAIKARPVFELSGTLYAFAAFARCSNPSSSTLGLLRAREGGEGVERAR